MSFIKKITNTLSPATLDNFRATLSKKGGLARANKFAIFMTPPTGSLGGLINTDLQGLVSSALSGNFNLKNVINDPRDIGILCETCSLPAKAFETIPYTKGGVLSNRKFIVGQTLSDVTFTFHLTNDYYIRKIFDKWTDLCFNPRTKMIKYGTDYKTDVVIQQLDQNNVPIYGIKLLGAYPTGFDRTILSNNVSATQTFTVTMTYDEFVPEGALQSALSSGKSMIERFTNTFLPR